MVETVHPKKRGRPPDRALARRRREEILDTAARIFAARGYPGTGVQEVADALEIGKGTVYRYFPSKKALFLATVDRGMRRLNDHLNRTVDSTPNALDKLVAATVAYLGFFDDHPEFAELLIQERAEFKDRPKPTYFEYRDTNVGRWRELLQELIDARRIRDIPVQRILDVLGDFLYGTMFTNLFAGRTKSLEQQAREMVDISFLGILDDAERERFRTAMSNREGDRT